MDLVVPGEVRDSFLYEKIAAKTLGTDTTLTAMPPGLETVSEPHLAALALWIAAGAPQDLVVEGTADLLDTCLPPADPLKVTPPPAPPPAARGSVATDRLAPAQAVRGRVVHGHLLRF